MAFLKEEKKEEADEAGEGKEGQWADPDLPSGEQGPTDRASSRCFRPAD